MVPLWFVLELPEKMSQTFSVVQTQTAVALCCEISLHRYVFLYRSYKLHYLYTELPYRLKYVS
jgi:hypothetical protein